MNKEGLKHRLFKFDFLYQILSFVKGELGSEERVKCDTLETVEEVFMKSTDNTKLETYLEEQIKECAETLTDLSATYQGYFDDCLEHYRNEKLDESVRFTFLMDVIYQSAGYDTRPLIPDPSYEGMYGWKAKNLQKTIDADYHGRKSKYNGDDF